MKKSLLVFASMMITLSSFGQIAFLQYRTVPSDKEAEFVERETKYWSKVAKAAIDQGHMTGWSLWRKVGITETGGPNYVFVNNFESVDKMDPSKIWTDENIKLIGVDPDSVETNSFTTVPFSYYVQLEDTAGGDYKYAIVNYAKPDDLTGFVEENKTLWKPLHQQSIKDETNGMTSWGLMTTIYPKGKKAKFSSFTWDGFNTMADAMKYLSYSSPDADNNGFAEILSKSKMSEYMPDGFEYSILYELVMQVGPASN